MSGPVALPPPVRVSDAERDRALRVLKDASAVGRLSNDSFQWRVDEALHARTRDELRPLVADLPSGPRVADWVERAASSLSGVVSRVRGAFLVPRTERLALPRDTTRKHTLGRHPAADMVLGHPTVSRWHAELRFDATDGWVLSDLGSTNGTRVNGWRLAAPQAVRPGDRVTFGLVSVVVAASRERPATRRRAAARSG